PTNPQQFPPATLSPEIATNREDPQDVLMFVFAYSDERIACLAGRRAWLIFDKIFPDQKSNP
ncbi:MAG TPA: hypothetical protein VJH71_02175, partial [Candidatus Paceibacterota bacterium]